MSSADTNSYWKMSAVPVPAQFQIGTLVEIEGESFKILNYEKPYEHFAGHCTIQSLQTGRVVKVFKHQLWQSEPVNVHAFLQDSQSDEELSNLEVEPDKGSTDPSHKMFKSCSETELDKISQARNEKNTDKQTARSVKYRQTDSLGRKIV